MTLESCHRFKSSEDLAKGMFGDKKKASFQYVTVAGIEDSECPVLLGAYEIKGRSGWGYVAFEEPKYSVPARVKCNGSDYNSRGKTICQSKIGLIQEIIFGSEMQFLSNAECPIDTEDNYKFTYKMSKGECTSIFKLKGEQKYHSLTTIGFEEVIVRGE